MRSPCGDVVWFTRLIVEKPGSNGFDEDALGLSIVMLDSFCRSKTNAGAVTIGSATNTRQVRQDESNVASVFNVL